MRSIAERLTMAVLVILLTVGTLNAQEAAPGAREADHEALRALLARVVQAINGQDMDTLASCFTKEFVFTTVDQSVLTDTSSLKEYYDRMLRQADSPVTAYQAAPQADVLTVFLDANSGYCFGSSNDVYTLRRNGRKVPMPCRWTATVVKDNGTWKVAALHCGVNVMKNPVLDAAVMSLWRNIAIAGGIGLLFGGGIGVFTTRRKRADHVEK